MPEFTTSAPEWATHVAVWGLPLPEFDWFPSKAAADACAKRMARAGYEAIEVREVGA